MVVISEADSVSSLQVVHGFASQMGPPASRPPSNLIGASGRSTSGSTAATSTAPSSQPTTEVTEPLDDSSNKKARIGVQKSWVWDHFIKIENNKRSMCKHCKVTKYKIGGKSHGTSNMIHHLEKCAKYKETLPKVAGGQQTLDFQPCKPGEEPQLVGVSFSQAGCRRALIRFIITDEMAFRIVHGEGFRAFCKYLEPRFKIPGRMTVYRDVISLFLEEKHNLKDYFKRNKVRVCLTTDTWTSMQNYNYMVVTAHFIDQHWKLHKRIICFCLIDSHEGKHIGMALEKCLLEWGLERVFTVTLDNAAANKVAIDYLKKRVVSWGSALLGAKFLHVRCAAHILALVVKDGMKKYHTSILRIRAVVKYVTSSPARLKKFTDATKLVRIDCKKGLILDVRTRWNSTYLMLVAAERYEKAFARLRESDYAYGEKFCFDIDVPSFVMGDGDDNVDLEADFDILVDSDVEDEEPVSLEEIAVAARKANKKKKPRVHAPESYDWNNCRVLILFLKVFYEATVQFSASTYVTSHSFLLELGIVRQELDDWQESHDDPFLSHMGHVMLKKYNKYWGEYKKMNPLMFIAVLLDPREKEQGLIVSVEDLIVHHDPLVKQRKVREWVELVKTDFQKLYDSYKLEYLNVGGVASSQESVGDTSSTQSGSSCTSGRTKYLDKRLKRKSQLSSVDDHGKSELERYLTEKEYSTTNENSVFDILQWWKVNSARFEVLPLIAKDIFVIPISSVASESAFSAGKRILDPFRSSLKPRTLESLILLQNWIRTPIDMDPSTLGVEEEEIDSLESELFGELSGSSIIIDDD